MNVNRQLAPAGVNVSFLRWFTPLWRGAIGLIVVGMLFQVFFTEEKLNIPTTGLSVKNPDDCQNAIFSGKWQMTHQLCKDDAYSFCFTKRWTLDRADCNFHPITEVEKSMLFGSSSFLFIGDSITRLLYHKVPSLDPVS